MSNPIPVELYGERPNYNRMWATALTGCEYLNISLHDFFVRGIKDKWPRDRRVQSLWIILGPPLLHQLELIAQYFEDLAAIEAEQALEAEMANKLAKTKKRKR